MILKKLLLGSIISLVIGTGFLNPFSSFSQQVIGTIKVQGNNGILNLGVISEADAISNGHGVVKIALDNGVVGAAWLVATTDPEASEVRIQTPYGTRAWKVLVLDLWARAYGESSSDIAKRICLSHEGGLAVAGVTSSFSAGLDDDFFINLDMEGSINWSFGYGYSLGDILYAMTKASGGGYLISGYTYNGGANSRDIDVRKINDAGGVEYEFWYGTTEDDACTDIILNLDGTFVQSNYTSGMGAGNYDFWVRKNNPDGSNIWGYTYGGSGSEETRAIARNTSGGYGVVGYTNSYGAGSNDMFFIILDGSGSTVKALTFGGTGYDQGHDVIMDSDGNYLLVGVSNSFGAGLMDFYFRKLDANGDDIWSFTYGGTDNDVANAVIETSDQGYCMIGQTESYGAGNYDMWVVKIDNDGSLLWANSFGGSNFDSGVDLIEGPDGYLYVLGYTGSMGAGNYDIMIFKLSPNGASCLTINAEGDWVEVTDESYTITKITEISPMKIDNELLHDNLSIISLKETNLKTGNYKNKTVTPATPVITTICD